MKNVKMLQTQAGPNVIYKKGSVHAVSPEKAKRWIENKVAEETTEPVTNQKKAETADKKETKKAETAVKSK
jgi:hypothetical protein